MNTNERLDRLEEQFKALDRKLWFLIIILLVFAFKGENQGLLTILTGNVIFPEVRSMVNPAIFLGLAAAAGSAFRSYLGFTKKRDEKGAAWDWSKFLISVLPSSATAFVAAYALNIEMNAATAVMVFLGAAGFNSLQDKFSLQKK